MMRNTFAIIPKEAAKRFRRDHPHDLRPAPAEAVRAQLDTVAEMLGKQFPKVRQMLLEAKNDLTAFAAFPERH